MMSYAKASTCALGVCHVTAAGYFAGVQVVEAMGVRAPDGEASPEFVAEQWAKIHDMSQARPFANATQALVDTFGPGSK